ncbi:MAG: SRPBCC family protein [Bacteroidales bacterium]|jgi:carbon monoxide dehydrogenase subunit G|nr:SRPBCC family protein [Bacteroidales bacterium]
MAEESEFISRTGTIEATADRVYAFATDVRNFNRFVPGSVLKNWSASNEECSFEMTPIGHASVKIVDKEPCSLIRFEGSAFNETSFRLWFQMKEPEPGTTRFRIVIRADLNPLYKMMAAGPLNEFLEKLVTGVEKFRDWDDVVTDIQSP